MAVAAVTGLVAWVVEDLHRAAQGEPLKLTFGDGSPTAFISHGGGIGRHAGE
jgi:hypothetical protein